MKCVGLLLVLACALLPAYAWADNVTVTANAQSGSINVLVGDSVSFVGTATGCGGTEDWQNGQWDFGDGTTQTVDFNGNAPCDNPQTVNHVFTNTGTYTVTYSYESCAGYFAPWDWCYGGYTAQEGQAQVVVATKPVIGTGTGLLGTYFDQNGKKGAYFTGNTFQRIDPTINFDWGHGPPQPGFPRDKFSVRWEGQIQAQYSENYTIRTVSDDGIRVDIDLNQDGDFDDPGEEKVIYDWTNHGPTPDESRPLALVAGQKYNIRIEYFEHVGGEVAKLKWSSASTPREIVPQSQLYPAGLQSAYTICGDASHVYAVFGQTLDPGSATDPGNYQIDNGVTVTDAALLADGRIVTLTVTGMVAGQSYTLSSKLSVAGQTFTATGGSRSPGLIGDYYDQNGNANGFSNGGNTGGVPIAPNYIFTGNVVKRTDLTLNHNWGDGTPNPPAPGIPANDFSVRWSGQILTRGAGQYVFTTTTDDGVRLYVNGQRIIDSWKLQSASSSSASVTLAANTYYDITMEYFEHRGEAVAQLFWSGPGFGREIIPQNNLSHCTATSAFTGLQVLVPGETAAPGTVSGKTGAPDNQVIGVPFQVTVNAVDQNWNVMTNITDTVHLTATDNTASIQGEVALVDGTATFMVAFNQAPGPFTITATDITDGAKTADTSPPITVIPPQDQPTVGDFGIFDNCTTTKCNTNLYPVTPAKVPITTKIAGLPFSLEVAAWQTYYHHVGIETYYHGDLSVELLDGRDNSAPLDAHDCRSSWTPIAPPVSATIRPDTGNGFPDRGRVTVAFPAVPDAYQNVRVRVSDNKGNIGCSPDNFAIRPAYFAVIGQDNDRTSPGTSRTLNATTATGTPVHNAGQPFSLTVEPRNANNNKAANYTVGNPTGVAESILGPKTGTLTTGAWTTTSDGDAVSNSATYSEVGAFELHVIDPEFASVDVFDTGYCRRTIGLKWNDPDCTESNPVYANTNGSAQVGRFVPDHFAVTLNTPSFATGCTAGQFTYIGHAFAFATAPVITITAQNASNEKTKNYTGSLFRLKLDPDSVTGRSYQDNGAPAVASLQSSGLPVKNDPVIDDKGDGTGTITFSTGAGLTYAHKKPVTPFNSAIDLSIQVEDLDGVTPTGGPTVTFNNIGFDKGNEMRYGRLFLNSAVGSELVDLPMSMVAQYYQSATAGFVTNTDDTCASGVTVTLGNYLPYPGNTLQSGDTTPSLYQLNGTSRPTSLGNGDFGLTLSAPGAGHQGTVDVTAHVPTWLQFDWDGNNSNDNPKARAAFGIYKGPKHRIYQREIIGP